MASVGLAIAALQPESGLTLAQQVLFGPQANASPAQGANQQQDTVTLTGRTGRTAQAIAARNLEKLRPFSSPKAGSFVPPTAAGAIKPQNRQTFRNCLLRRRKSPT